MPPLPRSTLAGYAIAAVLVLVLGGRWLAQQGGAESVSAGPAATSTAVLHVAAAPPPAPAIVDVTGAVRHPGVYRLAGAARVRDAVARAGGASAAADTASVNLAAKLADGQQIVVPRRVPAAGCATAGVARAPGAPAAAGAPAGAPVSLGAATLEQLDTLPGVGPATAQKILDWRTQHGGFTSVDDLGEVPGIGPKKLDALRAQVQP